MNFISRLDVNFLDFMQNIDRVSGALNEGQGHRVKVPVQECVKHKYYARFNLHSYHCCREMNFISRLDVNFLDSTQNIDKVSGA